MLPGSVMFVLALGVSSAQTFTEFTPPTPSNTPFAITVGPDGAR